MGNIAVRIMARDRSGQERPTPTAYFRSDEWTPELLAQVLFVLAERAGAVGGVGLLSAHIMTTQDHRYEMSVSTDVSVAFTRPLAIPLGVIAAFGKPIGTPFGFEVRPYCGAAINVLDLHFPVFAGKRISEKELEPVSPHIFGTAFPVWHGGVFLTAAHVVESAKERGEVVLGRFGDEGEQIAGHGIEQIEVFREFDLALLRVPGLRSFPPIPLDLETPLSMFDEVSAVGYPFSIDPEYMIAVHRGFAGHIVAVRQLYRLSGQPVGYELSFQTPPGMSGAPLTHECEDGVRRCFGFIVEQVDTEFAGVNVRLGIAVSTGVLRSVRSVLTRDDAFCRMYGLEPAPQPPRVESKTDQQRSASVSDLDGWPDD